MWVDLFVCCSMRNDVLSPIMFANWLERTKREKKTMLTDHPKRSIGLHLYVGRWAEAIYKLSESPNRFKKKSEHERRWVSIVPTSLDDEEIKVMHEEEWTCMTNNPQLLERNWSSHHGWEVAWNGCRVPLNIVRELPYLTLAYLTLPKFSPQEDF